MNFEVDAHSIAAEEMDKINPELTEKFKNLILFLSENPEFAPKSRSKKIESGSAEHIAKMAQSFSSSREGKAPTPPETIPDEMVSNILNKYFDIEEGKLQEAKHLHMLSMGAENIVGDLLERYIASVMEPQGWVWCSGSTVKAVDFIKPPIDDNDEWNILQVKNRDNSENSSSSAIRNGTPIKKWHRTFSKKAETNWSKFPCIHAKDSLSEEGFEAFVDAYLLSIKDKHQ